MCPLNVNRCSLTALFDQLRTMALASVKRNEALPQSVSAGGLVILRDGDPGEPDVTLNPVHLFYSHCTEIKAFVPQLPSDGGEARLDVLLGDIGTALTADRSLGCLAETLTWSAAEISVLEDEGRRLRGL